MFWLFCAEIMVFKCWHNHLKHNTSVHLVSSLPQWTPVAMEQSLQMSCGDGTQLISVHWNRLCSADTSLLNNIAPDGSLSLVHPVVPCPTTRRGWEHVLALPFGLKGLVTSRQRREGHCMCEWLMDWCLSWVLCALMNALAIHTNPGGAQPSW